MKRVALLRACWALIHRVRWGETRPLLSASRIGADYWLASEIQQVLPRTSSLSYMCADPPMQLELQMTPSGAIVFQLGEPSSLISFSLARWLASWLDIWLARLPLPSGPLVRVRRRVRQRRRN